MQTIKDLMLEAKEAFYKMEAAVNGLAVRENDGYYWSNIDLESTVDIINGILSLRTFFRSLQTSLYIFATAPKEVHYASAAVSQLENIWKRAKKDRKLQRKTIREIHKVLQKDEFKVWREFMENVKDEEGEKK